MRNRYKLLYTLWGIVSILFLAISCHQTDIPKEKTGDSLIVSSLALKSTDIYSDSLALAEQYLLFFDDKFCVCAHKIENDQPLNIDFKYNKCVAFAIGANSNFELGKITDGLPSKFFTINQIDYNNSSPLIWYAEKKSPFVEKITIPVEPLVSHLKVEIINPPAGLSNTQFSINNLSDSFDIFSKTFSTKNEENTRTFSLNCENPKLSYFLFPCVVLSNKRLDFKFIYNNTEKKLSLYLDKDLSDRVITDIKISFEDRNSNMFAIISATQTDLYGSNAKNISSELAVYENRKPSSFYELEYLSSNGSWVKANVNYALCSNAEKYHSSIWNDWDNSKHLRDTMSFVNITHDFSTELKIRVKKLKSSFSSVKLTPSIYNIQARDIGSNTIEFTIPDWSKRKVSVEFDGDKFHNLMIFADKPDPDRPDPDNIPQSMIYFGPGEHIVNTVRVNSGQCLYIDEGAILYSNVIMSGDNTSIAGRGILSGEKLAHTGGTYASGSRLIVPNTRGVIGSNNVSIKDITLIDSPNWTIESYNVHHYTIENIKMINWILNGDGIDLCSCTDVTVKDCFLRTYDDCITLKVNTISQNDCKQVKILNNLIWADYARGIVIGPEAGGSTLGAISDVLVEDCVVMYHPFVNTLNSDGAGLSISQYPSSGSISNNIENITFRNITIDNVNKNSRPFVIWQKSGQNSAIIKDVLFENVSILQTNGSKNAGIYTNGASIQNLKFKNVKYNGVSLQNSGKLTISGNVDVNYE